MVKKLITLFLALHFTTAFGDPCDETKLNIIANCGEKNFCDAFEDIKVKNCNELDEKYSSSLEEYVKKIEKVFIADNSLSVYHQCIIKALLKDVPAFEKLSPIEIFRNDNFNNINRY